MSLKLALVWLATLSVAFAQLTTRIGPTPILRGAGGVINVGGPVGGIVGSRVVGGGYGLGLGGIEGYGLGLGGIGGLGLIGNAAPVGFAAVPSNLGVIGGLSGVTGLGLGAIQGLGLGGLQVTGPVSAAIITSRSIQAVDVPTPEDVITPTNLIIEPNLLPVNIEFRSQSSPVNVNQVHIPGEPGQVQYTQSEDEPDRLVHEVIKPVIQEVRETITPFRTITQEILPVQEAINTIVARGQNVRTIAAPAVQTGGVVGVARPAVGVLGVGGPVGTIGGGVIGTGGLLGIGGLVESRGLARGAPILIGGGGPVVAGGIGGGIGGRIGGGFIGSSRVVARPVAARGGAVVTGGATGGPVVNLLPRRSS